MKRKEFKIEPVQKQAEVIQFLDDKIYEFNSSIIGKYEGNLFTKVIRDDHNSIIAGITGWSWAMIGEINLLWVSEGYRKLGLGKMLLREAEDEITKKGCATILIRSYNFQAPAFYERHDYKTVFILDDFPNGYKQYNLVKKIPEFNK